MKKIPFTIDCEQPGCKKLARWTVVVNLDWPFESAGHYCTAHADALVNSSMSEQDGQHDKTTRPQTPR